MQHFVLQLDQANVLCIVYSALKLLADMCPNLESDAAALSPYELCVSQLDS
jgi:hypothetical protein